MSGLVTSPGLGHSNGHKTEMFSFAAYVRPRMLVHILPAANDFRAGQLRPCYRLLWCVVPLARRSSFYIGCACYRLLRHLVVHT